MAKNMAGGFLSSIVSSEVTFGENKDKLNLTAIKKTEKFKCLETPLEKPAAKRIKRAIGYEAMAEETSKWESVIDARRKEPQSKYPLNKPNLKFVFRDKHADTPMTTDLQREIYSLLADANLIVEKKVTDEEKVIKDAMKLDKVRKRSVMLWKKAKTQKIMETRIGDKIYLRNRSKSKKTHRLLKKEKMKDEKAEFARLLEEDPKSALEIFEKMDRNRIQERMSLRHKNSKWIHTQTARAANDAEARRAIQENEEIRKELLIKLDQIKEAQEKLMNEDDKKKLNLNEDIKTRILSEIQILDESSKDEDVEDLRPTPKRLMFKDKLMAEEESQKNVNINNTSDEAQTKEDNDDLIAAMFEEEIEKEFVEEKKSSEHVPITKSNGRKVGWNRWTGPGIVEPVRLSNPNKSTDETKVNPNKKIRSNVIYHKGRDLNCSLKDMKVTKLPYPFISVDDYEEYVSRPIGRQFVPETCHKSLISPPVVTKAGVVIKPISEETLLIHEKRKNKTKRKVKKCKNKVFI